MFRLFSAYCALIVGTARKGVNARGGNRVWDADAGHGENRRLAMAGGPAGAGAPGR
jgi:hypothetical protein